MYHRNFVHFVSYKYMCGTVLWVLYDVDVFCDCYFIYACASIYVCVRSLFFSVAIFYGWSFARRSDAFIISVAGWLASSHITFALRQMYAKHVKTDIESWSYFAVSPGGVPIHQTSTKFSSECAWKNFSTKFWDDSKIWIDSLNCYQISSSFE